MAAHRKPGHQLTKLLAVVMFAVALSIAGFDGTAHAAKSKSANSKVSANPPRGGLSCADGRSIGVLVCFEPLGDKFWVLDTRADGHHVAASFNSDNLELGACHNYHGAAAEWTYCDQFAGHISEHINIQFSGLVMEGDRILDQSETAYARTT